MMRALSEELHQQIESVLADLLVRSEGEAVFLCDKGGNILAHSASHLYSQQENIAALAAGSFYATRELARLLGEPGFQCVFHQGVTSSVYMQCTTMDLLVLVVFGKESNPGLVRLYANEGCQVLDRFMRTRGSEAATGPDLMKAGFELDHSKQVFSRASRVHGERG
jgi:predicted regulator of Ras-like GTPase activity (Roadblock/LC7/MglB family)